MKLLSFLRLMLPYRRTTEAKAREAIVRCGISPDAIAWEVPPDSSFVFGRKHPDDDGLTFEQVDCIVAWTRRERIRTWFIGWETRDG